MICHLKSHPKGHFSVVLSLESYWTGHFVIVCLLKLLFKCCPVGKPLRDNFIHPKLSLVTIYIILDINPRGHFASGTETSGL